MTWKQLGPEDIKPHSVPISPFKKELLNNIKPENWIKYLHLTWKQLGPENIQPHSVPTSNADNLVSDIYIYLTCLINHNHGNLNNYIHVLIQNLLLLLAIQ